MHEAPLCRLQALGHYAVAVHSKNTHSLNVQREIFVLFTEQGNKLIFSIHLNA